MKNHLKFTAVVLISLIVILPFYIADAYAGSLQITRSSGSANVDNYFDGLGDNWVVEADAYLDGATVTKDMIHIEFLGGEEYFDECTASAGNHFTCRWESGLFALTEEDVYSYPVYLEHAGKTYDDDATIVVDATEPGITINNARQLGDKVEIDLEVTDGDADTSSLLDRIEFWAGGLWIYTIPGINKFEYDEVVELDIPKVGTFDDQTIIVKAYDRLGHKGEEESSAFVLDLTLPYIDDASFRIGNLVDYAPSGKVYYDISVNITEDKGLEKVVADFSDLGIGSAVEADECVPFSGTDIYSCVWEDRYVSVTDSVDITITATDINGNTAVDVISKLYAVDNVAPDIEFVGSAAHYDENSYIKLNEINTIIAHLEEGESGITADDIRMNFIGVNPSLRDYVAAESCEISDDDPNLWICKWNVLIKKEGTIILVDAPDNAGNELPSEELSQKNRAILILDDEFPEVVDVRITSLGALFTEEREYLQSGDFIKIEARVKDNIGVRGFADFSDIIIGGEERVEADECIETAEDIWTCTWLGAGPVVDGYINNAPIRFYMQDFVGNEILHTEYREVLEVAGDITPNYWNIGEIENTPDAIDRQTTHLTNHRMYFKIPLETPNNNVKLLAAGVRSCISLQQTPACADNDCLFRYYLVNNQIYSREPYLVLELKTFTGDVGSLDFTCKLDIFSQYRKKAVEYPETKEVNVTIPFYNLPLGAEAAELRNKIKDKRHKLVTGFYGTIDVINDIAKYGKLICESLSVMNGIFGFWNAIVNPKGEATRAVPVTQHVGLGLCATDIQLSETNKNLITKLKPFCDTLTCRKAFLGWLWDDFQTWQDTVLGAYSSIGYPQLLGPHGKEMVNPYDNLFLSIMTLCIPGIAYNFEKMRQIECRYIYCLENEIPAGTATTSTCRDLLKYQKCKWVTGEWFHIFPPAGAVELLMNKMKNVLKDPIGLFKLALTIPCYAKCSASNTATTYCLAVAWVGYVLDLANDLVAIESGFRTINYDYCSEVL